MFCLVFLCLAVSALPFYAHFGLSGPTFNSLLAARRTKRLLAGLLRRRFGARARDLNLDSLQEIGIARNTTTWFGDAWSLLGLLLLLAAPGRIALAQSASFADASTVVASGFPNVGSVSTDSKGNAYVTDFNNGTITEIYANGATPQVVVSGLASPIGVSTDGNGNFYVGEYFLRQELKIAADGTRTVLATNIGGTASLLDANGNLYVTGDSKGVTEITPTGQQSTIFPGVFYASALDNAGDIFSTDLANGDVAFLSADRRTTASYFSGLVQPWGIAVDPAGNLFVGDEAGHAVYERFAGTGAIRTLGTFDEPSGLALDARGDLFVSVNNAGTVLKLQLQSADFGTVNVCPANQGSPAPCSQSETFTFNITGTGPFGTPVALTEGAPNLDFTITANTCSGLLDFGTTCSVTVQFAPTYAGARNGAVELTDPSGNVLATTYVHGIGQGPQLAFSPGTMSTIPTTGLGEAAGIAVDGQGDLFVSDSDLDQVVRITPAGSQTTFISGVAGPQQIALDGSGNLLIPARDNDQVLEVSPAGTILGTLGSGLNAPNSVAVDGAGNVYIADTLNNRIVEVLASTGTQLTLATDLQKPLGVAVDGSGNVFVADTFNQRVVELPAGGGPETVIGSSRFPSALALDGAGNVFIADGNLDDLIEVPVGGAQQFNLIQAFSPQALTVDAAGDLFMLSASNNSIVELNRSQAPSFNFAATPVGSTSTDSPMSTQVQNIGNQPLTGSFAINSNNFLQTSGTGSFADCTGTFSLTTGQLCNVSIAFDPQSSLLTPAFATFTDNSLNSANPAAVQTISLNGFAIQAVPAVSLSGTANPNGTVTFSVILGVSGNGPAPTGSVTIAQQGSGVVASGVLLPGSTPGTVSFSTTTTQVFTGMQSFTAQYKGDLNYQSAASNTVQLTFTVTPTLTFSTPAAGSSYAYGQSFAAAVKSNSTGLVSYTAGGAASVTPAGMVTITGVGPASLTASQAASTGYTAASATVNFNAVQASSKPTLTATPVKSGFGTAAALTVMVVPQYSGTPTGMVMLYEDGKLLTTVALVGGSASLTTGQLTPGQHSFTATYLGDTNFTGSGSNTSSLNVTSTPVMLRLASTNLTYPEPAVFDVIVTPASGKPEPTGTVSIYDGSTLISKSTLYPQERGNDLGLVLPPLSVGQHTLTAVYSGDSNYAPGTATPVVVTVHAAPVQLSLKCANTTLKVGQTLSCTVTAHEAFLPVSGTVTYTVTGWGSGSVTLNRQGQATITYPASAKGNFTLTASYAAQGDYQAAQPAKVNFTVNGTTSSHSVGGTVSGLSGTVSLVDNGGNSLSISRNGAFTFSTAIDQGSTYDVTVATQPLTETCTVSNGAGTVGTSNVTNVAVDCKGTVPTASSISPASGQTAGATVVTVNGTNFVAGATSVTIGSTSIPASLVMVNSATLLTFLTPAAAAGEASVAVTTPSGTSAIIPGGFTYEAAPTSSCVASPSTVSPGDSSTISSLAMSAGGLALTYSYSATAGIIAGGSPTATLVTTGVAPGTITVTCTVVDSVGNMVSANTKVVVAAP